MHRLRSSALALSLTAALTLAGCSEETTPEAEDVGATVSAAAEELGTDLGDLGQQAADEAGAAVEDAQATLEDLEPEAREDVENAIDQAGNAITDAQGALEDVDNADLVQDAEASLAEAREDLTAAAENVDSDQVRSTLEALGERIEALSTELQNAAG
jgi:cytochrome c556